MPTVLVVDDARMDRRLVGGLLGKLPDVETEYASNGREALARLSEIAVDLIVTDLLMPEQDGLALVRAVRDRHSNTPVILMTAYGSEELAVEALEAGAAGYVPKARLAQKLLETVEEVLAVTRVERDYERLLSRLCQSYSVFRLDNDLTLFDPLVDLAQQLMGSVNLCDATDRFRVGVALKEALTNACYHGNLELGFEEGGPEVENLPPEDMKCLMDRRRAQEPYSSRLIQVEWKISSESARFVVTDEGPGFDLTAMHRFSHVDASGVNPERGISLMRSFMDEVTFNQRGNEVTLVKRADRL